MGNDLEKALATVTSACSAEEGVINHVYLDALTRIRAALEAIPHLEEGARLLRTELSAYSGRLTREEKAWLKAEHARLAAKETK